MLSKLRELAASYRASEESVLFTQIMLCLRRRYDRLRFHTVAEVRYYVEVKTCYMPLELRALLLMVCKQLTTPYHMPPQEKRGVY